MQFLNNVYNAVRYGQVQRTPINGQTIEACNDLTKKIPLQFCRQLIELDGPWSYERGVAQGSCVYRIVDGVKLFVPYSQGEQLTWYQTAILKLPHSVATRVLAVGEQVLPLVTKKTVNVFLGVIVALGARDVIQDVREGSYIKAFGKTVLIAGTVAVAKDFI